MAEYQCDWFIMPDPDRRELIEDGWATVCISNFVINKRKCYLKMKLDEAEAVYGQKFRYVDIEISRSGFPKEIKSYTSCGEVPLK
jgi:hypothetical protein